jgi:hypothetical protein
MLQERGNANTTVLPTPAVGYDVQHHELVWVEQFSSVLLNGIP